MYWNELTWSKQNKTELINSFCPKKFSLMKIQAIPSLADSVFLFLHSCLLSLSIRMKTDDSFIILPYKIYLYTRKSMQSMELQRVWHDWAFELIQEKVHLKGNRRKKKIRMYIGRQHMIKS